MQAEHLSSCNVAITVTSNYIWWLLCRTQLSLTCHISSLFFPVYILQINNPACSLEWKSYSTRLHICYKTDPVTVAVSQLRMIMAGVCDSWAYICHYTVGWCNYWMRIMCVSCLNVNRDPTLVIQYFIWIDLICHKGTVNSFAGYLIADTHTLLFSKISTSPLFTSNLLPISHGPLT